MVAGARGYCCSGSRGYWGLSLISVPGPEEDFLKGTLSITRATADTWVRDTALALEKQHHNLRRLTGQEQVHPVLRPWARMPFAVACYLETTWESGIKMRGCAAQKEKQRAANWVWGESIADAGIVTWSLVLQVLSRTARDALQHGLLFDLSHCCQWNEVYPVVIPVDLDFYFLNKSN